MPTGPVILVHTILDRINRVFVHQLTQISDLLLGVTLSAFLTLEFRIIIHTIVIKLGSSAIHGYRHILARLISSGFDSGHNRIQGIFRTIQCRSETALITYSRAQTTIVQYFLQRMENLCAHTKPLTETLRTYRTNHEFLKSDRSVGVRTSIDNVHHRNRQHVGICSTDITI